MRLIASLVTVAAIVAAVPASAHDRLSEASYLRAARCQGLAHAVQLGATNTASIDAFMKAQGERRSPELRNRARAERQSAQREAASASALTRLQAELQGRCSSLVGAGQVAAVQTTAAN